MTLLFIFITCAFTLFALFKMVAPFLSGRDEQIRTELLDAELREIEELVARKSALLLTLRDIEYDWETAKISEEDYKRFKKSCERQAVGVMRRLDTIHGGRGWETIIDEELARRRNPLSDSTSIPEEPQPAEDSLPTREPVTEPNTASGADNEMPPCRACGAALEIDDRFCGKCGTPVEALEADPVDTVNHPVEATG